MVARVQVPEQAVRGHELVIWGVTGGAGASVFVVELPPDAVKCRASVPTSGTEMHHFRFWSL
jgi:hypothetical protein